MDELLSGESTFFETPGRLSIGQCAALACLLEVSAPKPGNVHRGADFEDVTFIDFAASAVAIAPVFEQAQRGVGETILSAVRATRRVASANTNLGMILLQAPLAAASDGQPLHVGVKKVLENLQPKDCYKTYEAIRLAQPGGLGSVDQFDVADPPPDDLLAAMKTAAGRDMIARQYAEGFRHVFHYVVPWLTESPSADLPLTTRIIITQLRLMSEFPDTLIARKCGIETAEKSATLAQRALDSGSPNDERFWQAVSDLDFWLRADHHRRNPGATADMIAAGLYVALREQMLDPPFR